MSWVTKTMAELVPIAQPLLVHQQLEERERERGRLEEGEEEMLKEKGIGKQEKEEGVSTPSLHNLP